MKKRRHKDRTLRSARLPFLKPAAALLLVALIFVLIWPLRGSFPVPAFLATLALFMVPGLLLARLTLGEHLTGVSRLPVAFALSASLFGLAALPVLLVHGSLTAYLTLCGLLLAASLGWIVYKAVYARLPGRDEPGWRLDLPNPLWVPFLGLSGVLAYKTLVRVQQPFDDGWVYLGYVREYLSEDRLGASGGFSRISVNGWLVVQAAVSRVSGVEHIEMVLELLAPTLAVVALLALYALGRVLFENETAALLAGTLAALLLLVNPGVPLLAPGGEFVGRISEDKYAVRFVFLPVVLIATVLFVRERRLRYLGLFAFLCLGTAAAHPIGLALAALAVGSFGAVHLVLERSQRDAWRVVGGLAAMLLGILVPPAAYLLATGSPILSRLESARSDMSSYLLDYWQYEQRLLEVGDGSYIVHPSLLLDPLVVAVYVVGIPLLVWKLKKSLAARLLLGVLVLAPIPTYAHSVAGPLGEVIGPWVLIRFSWPITLAMMLTAGWVCYEALVYLGSRLERSGPVILRKVPPLLPLVLVCILAVAGAGPAWAGLRSADRAGETPQNEASCHDPVFAWMGGFPTLDRGLPGRVLAPEEEGSCVPAHTSTVETLGSRDGITRRSREELNHFYGASVVDGEMVRMLADRRIDYVLLRANSPLVGQLEHLPGFAALDNPGERYRLFAVDREGLGVTPVVAGNSRLAEGDPEGSIESHTATLENSRSTNDERLLAYIGLGRAYEEQGLSTKAVYNYEAAAVLDPEDPVPHELAGEAYEAVGNPDAARGALERAAELAPQDVELRTRLADLLLETGYTEEAVAMLRETVESYPDVPAYRVDLGEALALAGDWDAAGEEFDRAVHLDPFSARVHASIGDAYLLSDDPYGAAAGYERAVELEPRSQPYAWRLGISYSELSVESGWQEEYFEKAEETFTRAGELEPEPGEQDYRGAVLVSLGDLYRDWDRDAEARTAYEEASRLDPESGADERLEELRG